ncbi:hypothetical protein Mgrana_02437 [Meiothermus granaticius NBRC 107808]|uniref:Uncharacterized protein n=1 Tax=Meiothermus granaticius NBRC 107808 TaxID=1227551 RepID=A0A399F4F2_9DEIN|nr:hypothetical protein Mgrana_02437 [Meiothermus granaticius NBRC 107808]
MSYQEIKSIVALVSTLLINGLYGWYVFWRYQQEAPGVAELFRFWAVAMLIFMGVALVAQILITVVFRAAYRRITGETEPSFADELDRTIGLRATRNAYYAFALGLVVALLTQVLSLPPVALFATMFLAGIASEVAQALTQLYYYRRGV